MRLSSDREYFRDIGPDGKLDPGKFQAGTETASDAFVKATKIAAKESISVKYTRYEDDPDNGPGYDEKERALKGYATKIFSSGAVAACNHAENGYIGAFPQGTMHLGSFHSPKWGTTLSANMDISQELEHFQPIPMDSIQQRYDAAAAAKKGMAASRVGVIFMVIHFLMMLISALPLIPGMEHVSWFGLGWNWAIVIGGCLSLLIAWCCHMGTANNWTIPGIIHMLFTFIFLLWQAQERFSVKTRAITAAVILVIAVISIIRYLIDGYGGFQKEIIEDFKNFRSHEIPYYHCHLRFCILWYRNITGKTQTPFDTMENTLMRICQGNEEYL